MAEKGWAAVLTVGTGPGNVAGKTMNAQLNMQGNAVDVSTRSGAGWKEHIQGLKEWDATLDQLWVADDAALVALRGAYINGTLIHTKFTDAAGHGFEGDAIVTAFPRAENLDGALTVAVAVKGSGALSVVTPT